MSIKSCVDFAVVLKDDQLEIVFAIEKMVLKNFWVDCTECVAEKKYYERMPL